MPAASPLISAEELAARLDDPHVRVADVRWYLGQPDRGRNEYAAGHVPGAVFVDIETVLAAPPGAGRHPLPEPKGFAASLALLGFGDEHEMVAYDDGGGSIAARLWWMLDDLGHPAVRVLDGGYARWTALGLPTETNASTHPPAVLHLADRWLKVVDRDAVRSSLGRATILDARAGERYRGEVEPIDPVAGHIPTALSAPSAGNIGPDARLLPPHVLRDRFARLGIGDDPGSVITSCGSGITACHNALAMRVAGLPDPLLYPGSYSDWSSSGEPVATGREPGSLSPR
ncbi:MAG TPA: sulfurtransferase [Candidatus Limnocylindrales bacterium]|jgi:thiosulfate/3-mercaptopyruvate sulfurtransferase